MAVTPEGPFMGGSTSDRTYISPSNPFIVSDDLMRGAEYSRETLMRVMSEARHRIPSIPYEEMNEVLEVGIPKRHLYILMELFEKHSELEMVEDFDYQRSYERRYVKRNPFIEIMDAILQAMHKDYEDKLKRKEEKKWGPELPLSEEGS